MKITQMHALIMTMKQLGWHSKWSWPLYQTAAHQSLTSLVASVSALPVVIGWWYHDIGAVVRSSGLRCRWSDCLELAASQPSRPGDQFW